MIQIRHVPDELHRALKERAAAAGLSLSDFVKARLEEIVAVPAPDALTEVIESRALFDVDDDVVEALRADRDDR